MYVAALLGGMQAGSSPGTQMPDAATALQATLIELAVFGGLMLVCLYFLNRQTVRDLQLQSGSFWRDLLLGLQAFLTLLASVMAFGTLTRLMGGENVPSATLELGKQLAADRQLAAMFLGPVIWLKAALLEEFSRVFILSRLWRVYPEPQARWAVLLFSAVIFGLGHLWQGWYGVLGTLLIGLVLGWFYLRNGRFLPLILAHGAYDTMVMLVLIAAGDGRVPLP
jgi:membrane protease YdiL (CAAX protease family)